MYMIGTTTLCKMKYGVKKGGGLAGIKMKVGRATLAEDIERVRAVREAGEVTLFSLATQIRHGPRHRRLNFVVQ